MDNKLWIMEDNAGSVRYDVSPDLLALVGSQIPDGAQWPAAYATNEGRTVVVMWDDVDPEFGSGQVTREIDISHNPVVTLPIPLWVLGVHPKNTTICLRSEVAEFFEPLLEWYKKNLPDKSESAEEPTTESV